jgi:hypothetical protein
MYNYFFNETQEQARKRLTKMFKGKYSNTKNIDLIFSKRIRDGMLYTSLLTENVFSDRVASHLFLELFLLFHANKTHTECHTKNWIKRYYPEKLNTNQIVEIHKTVLLHSKGRYGCFGY